MDYNPQWYRVNIVRPQDPFRRRRYKQEMVNSSFLACTVREEGGGVRVRLQTGRSLCRENGRWDPPYDHSVPFDGHFEERVIEAIPKDWIAVSASEVPLRVRQTYLTNRFTCDESIEFGDGGAATLVFPIWTMERVLSEEHRCMLLDALEQRARSMHDMQSTVVEDIIDPSLYVHRRTLADEPADIELFEKIRCEWQAKIPGVVFRPFDEDLEEWQREDEDAIRDAYYDNLDATNDLEVQYY